MTIFLSTLSQMGFLFSFILLGFLLVKCGVMNSGAAGILSKLESYLFIPALVMGTCISNFTVENLSRLGILFLSSAALLVIIIIPLALFTARLCSKDAYIRNIFSYGLIFANFAYVGNAVISALFPEIFMEYIIFTLPHWMVIYLWAVPELLISDGGKKTLSERLKAFINPMMICMVLGMVIGITGLQLPGWVSSVITSSGNCMSPLAMLLTGMTIAEIDLKKTFTDKRIYAVTGFRLLVFPLVFLGITAVMGLCGISVDRTFLICALCTLAMPLGLNTIVIPAAYGKDTSVAAGMALVSHLLSCITIPLIFMLIQ